MTALVAGAPPDDSNAIITEIRGIMGECNRIVHEYMQSQGAPCWYYLVFIFLALLMPLVFPIFILMCLNRKFMERRAASHRHMMESMDTYLLKKTMETPLFRKYSISITCDVKKLTVVTVGGGQGQSPHSPPRVHPWPCTTTSVGSLSSVRAMSSISSSFDTFRDVGTIQPRCHSSTSMHEVQA